MPAGDTALLAERLAAIAADPAEAHRLSTAGREAVVRRYAVSRLVSDVDALYRRLLAARSTTPSTTAR